MASAPDFEVTRAALPSASDDALPLRTWLRDYEVTGLIGEGACSVVYLAWDHSLQRRVAIKEYLPASMAARAPGATAIVVAYERHLDTFKAGLKSFVNEARQLAQFDHPSLVKVYRFWEENGTAYRVMPYYEGPTLKAALAELGHVPSEPELRGWLAPVLNAVTVLHGADIWHQNIGPDAILLTPTGPVLLGFGSANRAIEAMNHTPAAALKPGFAAIEQYGSEAGTTRGPCTDLYALAATVYAAVTGAEPAAAADRLAQDRVRPLAVVAAGLYTEGFLAAIDKAMAIQPQQRPADHNEFRALMGDMEAPVAVPLTPRRDLMQEPFVALPPDIEREVTVPDRPVAAASEPAALPPAPIVSEAKPAPARRAAETRAPATVQRAVPSWMDSRGVPALGKRTLYGVVAGTCALIGIGALVLQFATRPAPRAPAAAAAASAGRPAATIAAGPASSTSATVVPVATATASAPAPSPRAAVAPASTPVAAPVVAAVPAVVRPASAAAVAPVVVPPMVTATTAPASSATAPRVAPPVVAPAIATARIATPTATASAASAPPLAARPIVTPPVTAPIVATPAAPPVATPTRVAAASAPAPAPAAGPLTPAQRQARCVDILQKASLEKITAAETEYFKRECK